MKHLASILMSLAIAAGCSAFQKPDSGDDQKPIERKDIALTKAQQGYVQAGNTFAFNLYRQVLKEQESSFMVSPLSIEYALSMLCNGAVGTTQTEILNLLGYKAGEIADVNEFCKYLTDALYKVDNTVKLNIANALIANTEKARLKKDYISILSTYYDALAKGYNFSSENAAALSYINNWAKEQTNGMIPKLLDDLSPNTYAMLMNAIYFKGIWSEAIKFDTKNTKADKFIREDKTETKVDYMNKQAEMGYAVAEGFRMVGLPYGNGAYQMVVMLPDEGKKLSDMAASITGETLLALRPNTTVKLKLPKFETENTIQLNEVLQALGMQLAFTGSADFSAMAEDPLYVSRVFQKAKIKVDEKGSEAAAVTVIDMKETSVGPGYEPVIPEFYATRPFMYLIREISTGSILFMGKYDGK